MTHLRVLAQKPHPIGSVESEKVRDYLIQELAAIGLQPEVQKATVVSHWGKQRPFMLVPAATVVNVLTRLPGTANTKDVMLVAHYDSVPTAPGASDDGSGVVAILETLRALKAGPRLQNDVICLFSDGEEPGLFGGKAFIDEHPWAKDVGVVLNLEARGSKGPSFMFETSEKNGWLIKEFARAAPYPVASSLMYEIYERMPNDTDMSVFKQAGLAGLNFSYVDGLNHYHTALDNVEEIDERSLQHHGTYALALTRHFGNLNLNETRAGDAVYFNVFGYLAHYSRKWVWPLTTLTVLVFVALVIVGVRAKQLTINGIGRGTLAWLSSATVAAIMVTLLGWIIATFHRGFRWIPYGDPYNVRLYKISIVLFAVAIVSALHPWFHRKIRRADLMMGAAFWWLILLLLTSFIVPAGSYLFLWPLLFALIGMALTLGSIGEKTLPIKSLVVLFLLTLPGVILISEMVYMLFATKSINIPAVEALLVVLLMGVACLVSRSYGEHEEVGLNCWFRDHRSVSDCGRTCHCWI